MRTATYIENMPLDVFEANFIGSPRLVLQLRYGQGAEYVVEKMQDIEALRTGILSESLIIDTLTPWVI